MKSSTMAKLLLEREDVIEKLKNEGINGCLELTVNDPEKVVVTYTPGKREKVK